MLELVKNSFWQFILFKLNIYRSLQGLYDSVLQYFNLIPPNDYRKNYDKIITPL